MANWNSEFLKVTLTTDNKIFTLRGFHPLIRQESDEDSGMHISSAGKRNQPDTSAYTI